MEVHASIQASSSERFTVGLEDVKGHLSPLLKMPSEILNEICRLVVASPPRILIVRKRDTQSSQPPVTRTCRELRDIALPIFYGLNSFRLEIDVLTPFQIIDDDFSRTVHNQAFGSWLAGLSSKSTSMLRSIYINLNCGPYCSMLSGVLSENDPDTTTVWTRNEANFKRLGLFLSCNDIGLTLIKNIDHPQLRPLKSELQLLAALTEMWQNLPREMLLCGKRIVSAAAMRNKQTGQSIEAEVSAHVASRDEARAAATNAKNEARYAMEDRWTELASLEPMPDDYDDLHDALVVRITLLTMLCVLKMSSRSIRILLNATPAPYGSRVLNGRAS